MGPRSAPIAFFICLLSMALTGCGSDTGIDPNESETTRAIRDAVRAEMEVERLQRIAPRIAHATAAAAADPTATSVNLPASDDAGEEAEAEAAESTPLERGGNLYAQNCSSCHGPRGAGDGPVGGSLVPQPAKHNDGGYMNALSNDHLFKVIKEGGPAVGKAATMAAWGGSMSDDKIRDVIVFVRSLAEPAYDGPMP